MAPGAELKPKAEAVRDVGDVWAPYREALERIMKALHDNDVAGALADVRRLLEAVAHAGVPPTARKPLDDVRLALDRGDVAAAIAALQPLLPQQRRDGAFWG